MIGGSGGGGEGQATDPVLNGGAGGGAILIAVDGTLTLSTTGTIRANGGDGLNFDSSRGQNAGGGSGGAIRIVADELEGDGRLETAGGKGGPLEGGMGRIRLEYNTLSVPQGTQGLRITPDNASRIDSVPNEPRLWLLGDTGTDANPTVRVVSVQGAGQTKVVPDDPKASFGAAPPDVVLPETDSVVVTVETTNIDQQTAQVMLRVGHRNEPFRWVDMEFQSVQDGKQVWSVNVPVSVGLSVLQVKVVR